MFHLFFLIIFVLLNFSKLSGERIQSDSPNVILIYADDLGWDKLSSYGHPFHETPNIDKLASQGIRFTSAYSGGPVCAPSRACLMSGQYVVQHGIYRVNQVDTKYPKYRATIPPQNEVILRKNIETMADVFSKNGYKTGYSGKWHLGYEEGYQPIDRGFDEMLLTRSPSGDKRYFYPTFSTVPKIKIEQGAYMGDVITNWAKGFIDRNKQERFFLYLPYFNVHGPHEAKEKLIEKYKKKNPNKKHKEHVYAAMHEHLDNHVGELLSTLKNLKLNKNTLIIFTSDNGHLVDFNEGVHRGGKSYLYEGGIRTPMIIRWPDKIKPGQVSDEIVHQVDLYPTLMKVIGAKPSSQKLDGINIEETLYSTSKQGQLDRSLFWHYPTYMKFDKHAKKYKVTPCSAIRKGNYKLIEYFTEDKIELFNLKNDPKEENNLKNKLPEKTRELKKLLTQWRKDNKAMMPVKKR